MSEKTAYRAWATCLVVGLWAGAIVLAVGWFSTGSVYDAVVAIEGYSVRARNLILLAYLLGMIAVSGLVFCAGVLLSLIVARRYLSAQQMQLVIYGDAIDALRNGKLAPGAGPVKGRILFIPMPIGILERYYGRSLRLDTAGLEALLGEMDMAGNSDEPSARRG